MRARSRKPPRPKRAAKAPRPKRADKAPRWAVVTIASLDLRKRPGHGAELGSQLLAGELARLERRSPDGLWWRLRGPDDYPGWARAWGLRPLSDRQAARWRRQARARVSVPYAVLRGGPGRGPVLAPAYLHSRFVPLETNGAWRAVELPDGAHGWIARRDLQVRLGRPSLTTRIRQLIGTPYLWGGRTAMGLDCSGFVQMVLMEDSSALPRDAHDQWLAARALPPKARRRAGDLVFFGGRRGRIGHVGILLGPATYAHSRGSVRLNSLDERNRLYDKDLADTVRGFGRLRLRPR